MLKINLSTLNETTVLGFYVKVNLNSKFKYYKTNMLRKWSLKCPELECLECPPISLILSRTQANYLLILHFADGHQVGPTEGSNCVLPGTPGTIKKQVENPWAHYYIKGQKYSCSDKELYLIKVSPIYANILQKISLLKFWPH